MTTHLLIITGLCATLIVGAGISIWGWLQVRWFVSDHPSIDDREDLEGFKSVVKSNMYMALAIMAVCGVAILLVVAGIALGSLGWSDFQLLLYVLAPTCTIGGVAITSAEKQMKQLTLKEESLRPEFDHVVTRWTSSAFPDW